MPVRLTAGRFFDMIKQGCKCYAGTRNDIVDAFMESIERCARPVTLETLDASYADLYDLCKTLYETDLAATDEAKRNELTEQMEQAAASVLEEQEKAFHSRRYAAYVVPGHLFFIEQTCL